MKNNYPEHGEKNESQRSAWRIAVIEIVKWTKAIIAFAGMAAIIFLAYWVFTRPADVIDQSQVEWFMWIGGGIALLAAIFGWEPKEKERKTEDEPMRVIFFRKSPKTPEKK